MSTPAPDSSAVLTFIGVSIIASVIFNIIFGRGIGDVSCMYPVKFSPANGAFTIWTPIYLFSILTLAEQIHSRSVNSGHYETFLANLCYGLTWAFAALWTSAFTQKIKQGGSEVPNPMGLLLAAVFLCLAAVSSMITVFTSTAWERSGKGSMRWISGVAIGLLSGWVVVAAAINVAIAYKVFNAKDEDTETPCDTNDDKYTILSQVNSDYATFVPLALSIAMCMVCMALIFSQRPNPIILIPLMWALFWMRPSIPNYFAAGLVMIVETIVLIVAFT